MLQLILSLVGLFSHICCIYSCKGGPVSLPNYNTFSQRLPSESWGIYTAKRVYSLLSRVTEAYNTHLGAYVLVSCDVHFNFLPFKVPDMIHNIIPLTYCGRRFPVRFIPNWKHKRCLQHCDHDVHLPTS